MGELTFLEVNKTDRQVGKIDAQRGKIKTNQNLHLFLTALNSNTW